MSQKPEGFTPAQRYEAAYRPEREGIPIAQAARDIGLTVKSYRRWRRSAGIPARTSGPLTSPIGRAYSVIALATGGYGVSEVTTEIVTRTESRQLLTTNNHELAHQIAEDLAKRLLSV